MARRKRIKWAILISLSVLAVLLAVVEMTVRVRIKNTATSMDICNGDPDCPHLFRFKRDRPGINRQGFRDTDHELEKPEDVTRVLILGDSVSFGIGVQSKHSFPNLLKKKFSRLAQRVEIIDTSVPMYTPYNEVQYYLHHGRKYKPDIILIAFTLNDMCDPLAHWSGSCKALPFEPTPALIPDPRLHQESVAPMLRLFGFSKTACELFRTYYLPLVHRYRLDAGWITHEGKKFPALLGCHILGKIDSLEDPRAPVWIWLKKTYDLVIEAAHADGSQVVLMINPLSYQLEPGYPFEPQRHFLPYCKERQIHCLDLLQYLRDKKREHPNAAIFLAPSEKWVDYWHYGKAGHAFAAERLWSFFLEEGLLLHASEPGRTSTRPMDGKKRLPEQLANPGHVQSGAAPYRD